MNKLNLRRPKAKGRRNPTTKANNLKKKTRIKGNKRGKRKRKRKARIRLRMKRRKARKSK